MESWVCELVRLDEGTMAYKLYHANKPEEFVLFGDLEGVDVMRAIKDRPKS